MRFRSLYSCILLVSLIVSACSGDGGNEKQPIQKNLPPTASAGGNQTVLPSATVNLNATANDSDGTIVSYSWTQTAGDTVSLSNPNSANTSFVMPSNSTATAFSFFLTVTDNDGASASDSVVINIVNATTDITGKVTFDLVPFNTNTNGLDYNNTRVSPARGVLVEAIDAQGNQIGSTVTDGKGDYALSPTPNTEMRIRISAHMKQTTGAKWDVRVTNNTNNNALYVTQGELFKSTSNASERNFHLASGWDGAGYSQTRAAGPFAILDAIYQTVQKFALVDPSTVLPPLEVRWSPNNSTADGNLAEGDIRSSFYDPNQGIIYLLGKEDSDTDEYDRHIIIHEWGHFFEDKLSRSDSIGGPHGPDERLDLRVAFGEGWGNAISAIITDDAFYRDSNAPQQASGWSMDIDSNSTLNPGWFNETTVQSILYDIYDNDNETGDNLALGLGPIYSVLTDTDYCNQPYFTSIYPFIDRLKSQQPSSANAIDSLLNAQQIDGSGDNGLNEYNDGGISSSLPVYKTATIGGDTIQVCSVNDAGTPNKLGNTVFVTFEVTASGSHTFTVTATGGATQSDPNFNLFRAGNYIARAEKQNTGEETLTINLTDTGIYQMAIYDWNNIGDDGIPGEYCFDLQISN